MSWRLLVIANETLVSRDVRDLVSARSAGRAARVLALFPADEVPIATHPPRASCRLERDVVDRARARVAARCITSSWSENRWPPDRPL